MMIIAGEDDTKVRFDDSVDLNCDAMNSSIVMLKNTKDHILVTRTELVLEIFEQYGYTLNLNYLQMWDIIMKPI